MPGGKTEWTFGAKFHYYDTEECHMISMTNVQSND